MPSTWQHLFNLVVFYSNKTALKDVIYNLHFSLIQLSSKQLIFY